MKQPDIKYLLEWLGEDPNREGLRDTPKRVLDAFKFWTSGYRCDPYSVLKTFEDGSEGYDEMVFQSSITFYSLCEHHLATFFGRVHIGYLPNKKIVGLSKLSRLVEIFSRRLTVQERITTQIADALVDCLQPLGVGVVIQARHLCIESRGVQKIGTVTTTSALRGAIKDHAGARAEFMTFVSSNSNTQF